MFAQALHTRLKTQLKIVSSALLLGLSACSQQLPALLLAGNTQPGFQDGSLTEARFNRPYLAYAEQGQKGLFIADTGNQRLRLLNSEQEVSTFAGSGQPNTENIPQGTLSPLSSDLNLSGPIYLQENQLYFASPGCIRSIDLNLPASERQIKTVYGNCYAQAELEAMGDQEPAFNPEQYSFKSIGAMVVTSRNQVYVSQGNSIYQIAFDGKINKVSKDFRSLFTMGLSSNDRPYAFYNERPVVDQIGPSGRFLVDVAQVLEDNTPFRLDLIAVHQLNAVQGDSQEGFFLITLAGLIYHIDKQLKLTQLGRLASEQEKALSISYSESEQTLYVSTASSIYQFKLAAKS